MLEGLEDEELEKYLDKNSRIVPLFEIDVIETAETYTTPTTTVEQDYEPNEEALIELRRAHDASTGKWKSRVASRQPIWKKSTSGLPMHCGRSQLPRIYPM